MAEQDAPTRRLTVPALQRLKRKGRPITALTAYDATFARLLDRSGVDVLLVGDSLGMVVQGRDDTLSVTMQQVIYHTQAVVRGSSRAHVVADMPFMSYQASDEEGVRNAGRLLKEGGAQAVKLEGGRRHVSLIERLTAIGIPVMGHLGLTPQSIHGLGGYRIQAKEEAAARLLLEDAIALEKAGAYAIVLEAIPADLARRVTAAVGVPTIGIGAGADCDGQVLVVYDMLGMDRDFRPKFVKRYAELAGQIEDAVASYVEDVRQRRFPAEEHSWSATRPDSVNANADATKRAASSAPIQLHRARTERRDPDDAE